MAGKKREDDFVFSIQHNEFGEVEAVAFIVRPGAVAHTKELIEGAAYADYDSSGRLLGVELLGPVSVRVFDRITKSEPADSKKRLRTFMKQSVPHAMLVPS